MEPKEFEELLGLLEAEREEKGNVYYWEDLGESFKDSRKADKLKSLMTKALSAGLVKLEKPSKSFFYFNSFYDNYDDAEDTEETQFHAWSWTQKGKEFSWNLKLSLPN